MGATAAQSVFGKITPINKNRGRLIDLDDGTKALVTVHPSYLLRLPDADAKAREYERFVDDLNRRRVLEGGAACSLTIRIRAMPQRPLRREIVTPPSGDRSRNREQLQPAKRTAASQTSSQRDSIG